GLRFVASRRRCGLSLFRGGLGKSGSGGKYAQDQEQRQTQPAGAKHRERSPKNARYWVCFVIRDLGAEGSGGKRRQNGDRVTKCLLMLPLPFAIMVTSLPLAHLPESSHASPARDYLPSTAFLRRLRSEPERRLQPRSVADGEGRSGE